MQEKYQLPNSEIFKRLQTQHFFSIYTKGQTDPQSQTFFKHICCSDPQAPGLISKIYVHLILISNSVLPAYCWAADIGIQLEPKNWTDIWQSTKSSTVNILALETNYKVFTRWYLVPARIAKTLSYYPSNFKGCPDCRHSYVHMVNLSSCHLILG